MHLRTLAAGVIAATLLPLTQAAAATPQMLALVATDGAVPFVCDGATCTAELTSFCLEETRAAPRAGRTYRLVSTRALALVVTGADGVERTVAPGPALRFIVTRRGVAAVRATIDRAMLRQLGAAKIAIRVGAQVSLLPDWRRGDGPRHSAADIARVGGSLRALGTAIVDQAGPNIETARIINRVINRLPTRGHVGQTQSATAWRAASAATTASPAGHARSRVIYRQCRQWTAAPGAISLRECLEGRHIGLLSALNKRYWDAARPGM